MLFLRTPSPAIAPLILSLLVAPADAATRIWPGVAPCAGTLQACIDAAADGDRIEIATDTAITSNILLTNRRLTLTAADGYSPLFQDNRLDIDNTFGFSGDVEVKLSKLRFERSLISAGYTGSGTATFDFRELQVSAADTAKPGIVLRAAGEGSVAATLYNNRISGGPVPTWSGLLDVRAFDGGTLDVDALYNHITRTPKGDGNGMGIYAQYYGAGTTGTVKLHGNTVRGHYAIAAVLLSEGNPDYPEAASYAVRAYNNVIIGSNRGQGDGIRLGVGSGQIDAQLINNTVTRVRNAFMGDILISGASGGQITGTLHNNILIGQQAINVNPGVAAGMTNSHNLVNGSVFGMTMGTGTVTAPARLISHIDARPAANSPAIDAGDNASLGFGLIFNALPSTDADALRRIKKKTPATAGSAQVDIGAYEYGDISVSHTTTTANTGSGSHVTSLSHAAIQDQPNANLFATPRFSDVASGQPVGSWEFSGAWSLYNKNPLIPMPIGARYNVFAAGAGSGVSRHVTTADSVSGAFSTLPLTDNSDMIVLAMQNYNAGSANNPHHTGVLYFGIAGTGSWKVGNLDSTQNMPVGVGFSIYAQLPSPNVFRVTATPGNHSGSILRLDHPLLNGNPCAQPVITRVFTHADGGNFDMEYVSSGGYWQVFDYNGMPSGSQFHVLVNPAQAETCGGEIFSDEFE